MEPRRSKSCGYGSLEKRVDLQSRTQSTKDTVLPHLFLPSDSLLGLSIGQTTGKPEQSIQVSFWGTEQSTDGWRMDLEGRSAMPFKGTQCNVKSSCKVHTLSHTDEKYFSRIMHQLVIVLYFNKQTLKTVTSRDKCLYFSCHWKSRRYAVYIPLALVYKIKNVREEKVSWLFFFMVPR